MKVAIIAARSDNDVIGRDNDIPWHLPDDLAHFKTLTSGHTIVMGRKTFESIGRPLPNRVSIVLTKNPAFHHDGVAVTRSFDDVLERARAGSLIGPDGEPEDTLFVIGGAEIYRLAAPHADVMFLTRVHAEVAGDARFPPFDLDEWRCVRVERHDSDERHAVPFTFETWERESKK